MKDTLTTVLDLLQFRHQNCDCQDCWMRRVQLIRIAQHASSDIKHLIDVNLESMQLVQAVKTHNERR